MYVSTIKSAALAAILVTVLVPGIASGVVLLSDSFDRPDNDDVYDHEAIPLPTGQAGTLSPLDYIEKDQASILDNQLRLARPPGGDTTWVVPNHDFIDTAITDAGGFVFEFDVDPVVGGDGTSNHWAAVSFGHSLESATTTSSLRVNSPEACFGITFTDMGTATAFLAGAGQDEVTIKVNPTGAEVYQVKITVATTSFDTGQSGTVTVNVDGANVYSALSVDWTGANYINVESYGSGGNVSDYDNLEIYTRGGTEPIPGDANLDDIVNDEDASILAAHWQQTGMGWGDGDFNGDTNVNDEDASILAAHWQESQEGAAAVPEPSTVVLLAFAAVSLLVWRRRK